MIIGIGSDIIAVPRIAAAIETHGARFLGRVFSVSEMAYASSRRHPAESFAARFAAKEACFKALGVGWPKQGVSWLDVEVRRAAGGAPSLVLSGRLAELAAERGLRHALVSLSHTESLATAMVILEGELVEGGTRNVYS